MAGLFLLSRVQKLSRLSRPRAITHNNPISQRAFIFASFSTSTTATTTTTAATTSARAMSSSAPSKSSLRAIVVDDFCVKQFNNPDYTGSQIHYESIEAFEAKINEYYESGSYPLVDGYAPFCKHLFVPNFANVKCGYMKVTEENKHLIKSCYEARRPEELPVLIQYFDQREVIVPVASFLDIILYSREQIIKENEAMPNKSASVTPPSDAPWGIISVKSQLCNFECPMQPITMMRNALGREQGGSGVPLEESKYRESIKFWIENVAIK